MWWWVACTNPEPEDLLLTGLYADGVGGEIAADVEQYEPRFPLWSDGAEKTRWIRLPGPIDTSDPDAWVYPEGTQLWKEFAVDGQKIETRMLHKVGGEWTRTTYLWSADQTEATRIRGREEDALGTAHDVPARSQCRACHGTIADTVLGFSAIQLAHDGDGLTLAGLTERGLLTDPIPDPALPGDAVDQAALGYLHANCGMCHHPQSRGFVPDLVMWLSLDDLGSVEETAVYRTGVGVEEDRGDVHGARFRIAAGDPDDSVIVQRMADRERDQMPPLATEVVDEAGLEAVTTWIEGL